MARPGGPAPWSGLDCTSPSLAAVLEALAGAPPPATRGPLGAGIRHAAVLAVLFEDDSEPHALLTRRAAGLRHHAREVSFPGGRIDASDLDPFHAALREAREEVALDPDSVRRVAALDRFVTAGSRTLIHPFVAVSDTVPEVRVASPCEVESIVTVALSELLLDEVWREEIWPVGGSPESGSEDAPDDDDDGSGSGSGQAVPERAITFFEVRGDTIWGATAAILRRILSIATGTYT